MARLIEIDDMPSGYHLVAGHLMAYGRRTTSRVGDTLELEDVTITVERPSLAIPMLRPGLNRALGRLEGAQLVSGTSREDAMTVTVPRIREFSDFWGSYGPRAEPQLATLVEELATKPDTRRAVLALWDPPRDLPGEHTDHPCTLVITFRIRDSRLNMTVHMRSNDVWRGWAYDATQFAVLQHTLANTLSCGIGTYTHHADSLHVYERDLAAVEKTVSQGVPDGSLGPAVVEDATVTGFGWVGCTLSDAQRDAVNAIDAGMELVSRSLWASDDSARLTTALKDCRRRHETV